MNLHRIAYVLNIFPKISETFIASELAELRRRGVEVLILSLNPPKEEIHHRMVDEFGLLERTIYDRQHFMKALEEFRPELLHAHFATAATDTARELAAKMGLPFTFTAHRYDIYHKPPPDFAARVSAAAGFITVSNANVRYISETYGIPAGRINVIPCGVDTGLFKPSGKKSHIPNIVCVARLHPIKNQRLLLEACALLAAKGIDFRCVLVGDGVCRTEIEDVRARLGLERVVELVGAAEQSQVLAWWQRATVAVLTSENEGMPVCLMEAAACGVPSVATAVGGIPELVVEGVTGMIVPPGDKEALAGALERILLDRELAEEMGEAARRRAVEHFSLSRQVDRLLAIWTAIGADGLVS